MEVINFEALDLEGILVVGVFLVDVSFCELVGGICFVRIISWGLSCEDRSVKIPVKLIS